MPASPGPLSQLLYQHWRDEARRLQGLARLDDALAACEQGLAAKADETALWQLKARLLEALERPDEAQEAIRTATRLMLPPTAARKEAAGPPDPAFLHSHWSAQAHRYAGDRQYETALDACETALQIRPDDRALLHLKGTLLSTRARHAEALPVFEDLLRGHDDDLDAWDGKARSLDALGRLGEALAAYEHMVRVAPDAISSWRTIAALRTKLGQGVAAVSAWDEVLTRDPACADAWRAKADALQTLGREQEAAAASFEAQWRTNRILESQGRSWRTSSPVVTVAEGEPGSSWAGSRYLTVHDRPAYHLTYWCGTCGYLFERMPDAERVASIDLLRDRTASGLTTLDEPVVASYATLLPAGDYVVVLRLIHPRLIVPGAPEDYFTKEQLALAHIQPGPTNPGVNYYRGSRWTGQLPDARGFMHSTGVFEFVVPMLPEQRLSPETVAAYRQALRRGQRPTAIALSCLDIDAPENLAERSALDRHWGWTHFLLDGHHKVMAAALERSPLTLLSFVSRLGLSEPDDVQRMLEIFRDA